MNQLKRLYFMANNSDSIVDIAEGLIAKGAVGKAKTYHELLRFLAARSQSDNSASPTEIEIAQAVFGKVDFHQSEDSSVRVYVYNLRKKLDDYYKTSGEADPLKLEIPKGRYTVGFVSSHSEGVLSFFTNLFGNRFSANWDRFGKFALLLVIGVVAGWLLGVMKWQPPAQELLENEGSVWRVLEESEKPTIIVLGDMFFFSEQDEALGSGRLIRDFSINSVEAFQEHLEKNPNRISFTSQTSLSYLTRGTAVSIIPIFRRLVGVENLEVRLSSDISSEDIRDSNLIYLGVFKSLGALEGVLQKTPFQIDDQYRELKDTISGELYESEGDQTKLHTDQGVYVQYYAPNGNLILVFSSFTDTGLLQMVEELTNTSQVGLGECAKLDCVHSSLAALFSVSGVDRTNLETTQTMVYPFDVAQ